MTEVLEFDRTMNFEYDVASQIAPGVRRLVARNPGPMTFKGTNTYLVGNRSVAVIDPGPNDPVHRRAILAAAGDGRISHILLTHTHRDHSAGLAALKAATGAITCGFGITGARRAAAIKIVEAREILEPGFSPDFRLADGARVTTDEWSLKAIHTPGHASDHLCFDLEDRGILFSGDHVMGWNTTVIAPPEGRMSDYFASLETLMRLAATTRYEMYLAGHGDIVREPERLVRSYRLHRQMREAMVLDSVRSGLQRVGEITDRVYKGIAPSLLNAARLSVLAHVEHLVERGLVSCDGEPSLERRFLPVASP